MGYDIEVGDLVVDDTHRPLFVVKMYRHISGETACDCVPCDDNDTNEDVWMQPMFFKTTEVVKVLGWECL